MSDHGSATQPRREHTRTDWWSSPLALVALPLLIRLPDILGILTSDPLPILSGLATRSTNWLDGAILPGSPGWNDGNAGVTVQALGHLAARDWWHGIVPWWNPYSGLGVPLAGEYQPAAFFLPFVLLLGLNNGLLWLKLTLQVVGGVSMAGLLRRIGIVPAAALGGGLLFEFNGAFAGASDGPMLPIAFLPMVLLGIEWARDDGWRLFAVAMAWLILAGFPETSFIEGLLALAWASVRFAQAGDGRWRFAGRVALGGACALLIAAPQLVAFLDYLPDAYVGVHAGRSDYPLPLPAWSMMLFPYLNGYSYSAGRGLLWAMVIGYLGLSTALLAVVGATGTRERGLRLMLVAWIVLAVCKTAEVPLVSGALDALPLLGRTVFSRYALPAWVTAALILAVLALDDWWRAAPGFYRQAVAGALIATAFVAASLWLDRSTLADWHALSYGWLYASASLAWGIGIATALLMLLGVRASRTRARALAVVLLCDAVGLFSVPLLSGRTERALDEPTLGFLRAHLGLQRFVTVGPVRPNYGAYFRLASINHNMVPVPRAWIDTIQATIDPNVDPPTFDGARPGVPGGEPAILRRLIEHPEAFERLGVAYALLPHGLLPRDRIDIARTGADAGTDQVLPPGGSLGEALRVTSPSPLRINGVSVRIGTFGRRALGTLAVAFCVDGACAQGIGALADATDNGWFDLRLDHDVRVSRGDVVAARFSLSTNGDPIAFWLARAMDAAATRLDPPRPGLMLSMLADGTPGVLRKVWTGVSTDIYALPSPASYLDATPACRLAVRDREHLTANCDRSSHLLRREQFLPGWTARVNGATAAVTPVDGVFQMVELPRGRSTVSFRYAPPHSSWAWAGLLIGIAVLASGGRGRRTMNAVASGAARSMPWSRLRAGIGRPRPIPKPDPKRRQPRISSDDGAA